MPYLHLTGLYVQYQLNQAVWSTLQPMMLKFMIMLSPHHLAVIAPNVCWKFNVALSAVYWTCCVVFVFMLGNEFPILFPDRIKLGPKVLFISPCWDVLSLEDVNESDMGNALKINARTVTSGKLAVSFGRVYKRLFVLKYMQINRLYAYVY